MWNAFYAEVSALEGLGLHECNSRWQKLSGESVVWAIFEPSLYLILCSFIYFFHQKNHFGVIDSMSCASKRAVWTIMWCTAPRSQWNQYLWVRVCSRELYWDDICIYLLFFRRRIRKSPWDTLSAVPFLEGRWTHWEQLYLEGQVQSKLLHDQRRMSPKRPFKPENYWRRLGQKIFSRKLHQYISHSMGLSYNMTLIFLHWDVEVFVSFPWNGVDLCNWLDQQNVVEVMPHDFWG